MSTLAEANAGRRVGGADHTTMLLWHLIDDAGEVGIDRDELLIAVGPRINEGHARRSYLAQRKREFRNDQVRRAHRANGSARWAGEPTWETIDTDRAKRFVVTTTLKNMRRVGSVTRDESGRYHVLRKPRAASVYRQDERVIDPSGMLTRLHMNTSEALRVLEPALERHRESPRAQLDGRGWRVLETLLGQVRQALEAGWPGVE